MVDILGFIVSIGALKWTKKSKNKNMTFGYHRVEIVGALLSIVFIWVATGYLIVEAYSRFLNPKRIKEKTFLIISFLGFLVNLFCLFFLHSHKHSGEHKSLNIRAAYVHVIGDLIQSFGVIIASVLTIFFPKMIIFDISCTIIFAIIVIVSTFFVSADALRILVECRPKNVDYMVIEKSLMSIERIKKVVDLKLWSISVNNNACAITVFCDIMSIYDYEIVLTCCKRTLKKEFGLNFISVQIETENTVGEYGYELV
ncbi:Zinc transporter 2 [Dictyocoela muelleri]|nr:Zinc transporter 2 [Dictyocoela muelleri]